MAKKEDLKSVQCDNADLELMRRQIERLETSVTQQFATLKEKLASLETPSPAFPAMPEPQPQPPVKVELPKDMLRQRDLSEVAGMLQTLNGTLSLCMQGLAQLKTAFEAMPKTEENGKLAADTAKKAAERVSTDFRRELDDKIENVYIDAYRKGKIHSEGNSFTDAHGIYCKIADVEKSLDKKAGYEKKTNAILILSGVILLLGVALTWTGIYANSKRKERNQLVKVEWLYRDVRSHFTDATSIQTMESRHLNEPTRERLDSLKTAIFNREAKGGPFGHFRPLDDWKPNEKMMTAEEKHKQGDKDKTPQTEFEKMSPEELLEENIRRAKNLEPLIDPKTRRESPR